MRQYILVLLILGIISINTGCVQPGSSQGTTTNTTNSLNPIQASPIPTELTSVYVVTIRPPATETTFSNDDHNSEVAPFITPNETNRIKNNISQNPQPKLFLFSIEEAPQLPVQPLFVPTYLPQGFSYLGGTLSSNGVISLRISNTTTPIMYIQAPQWSDVGGYLVGTDIEYHNIYANDSTYGCNEADSLHQPHGQTVLTTITSLGNSVVVNWFQSQALLGLLTMKSSTICPIRYQTPKF